MAGLYDRLKDPTVRANMAPYIGHVQATAQKHGIDPDFVTAQIVAESNGVPDALGDKDPRTGKYKAQGIYQVQTPWLADYGMKDNDVRMDPVKATTAIMPVLAKTFQKAQGDWALARLYHMRPAMAKKIQGGADPEKVLAGDKIALDQWRQFKALQSGQRVAQQAKPAAAPVPVARPVPSVATPQGYDQAMSQMLGIDAAMAAPFAPDLPEVLAPRRAAPRPQQRSSAADGQQVASLGQILGGVGFAPLFPELGF